MSSLSLVNTKNRIHALLLHMYHTICFYLCQMGNVCCFRMSICHGRCLICTVDNSFGEFNGSRFQRFRGLRTEFSTCLQIILHEVPRGCLWADASTPSSEKGIYLLCPCKSRNADFLSSFWNAMIPPWRNDNKYRTPLLYIAITWETLLSIWSG